MNARFPVIVLSLLLMTSIFSCVGTAPTREMQFIDSLNQRAYYFRYKDLDSAFNAAWMAYEESAMYKTGKAEACNNLGFCAFMQMNFDKAEQLFKEVYTLTQNELELLIADVGLMKIYQRAAMNKEFYDYRNNAIQRIKRIDEDKSLFIDKHERIRLNYAYTEFSIVSAIYYYYLQQLPEAVSSINEIKPELELEGDTSQLLYYHYIKGSASLTGGESIERRKLNEFDELFQTWRMASAKDYLYFEGNSLQGLANMMISPDNYELFTNRRMYALELFGWPVDSVFPLQLARTALTKFQQYNDIYQIAGAYVSIGRYLNQHGHYQEALDTLTKALSYVNLHHQLYYTDTHDEIDVLEPYVRNDTAYTEINWITGTNEYNKETPAGVSVKTVPEWISRIREQLSVSYAGLGMKAQSDYNRNIYLAILQFTRQNKELENRYLVLQQESKHLNILLVFVLIGLTVLILLFWIFNSHSKKRNKAYIARLRLTLDICQKVTSCLPPDIEDEADMVRAITTTILPDMKELIRATSLVIELTPDVMQITHLETEITHLVMEEENEGVVENPAPIITEFKLYVPDNEQPLGVLQIGTQHRLTKDEVALINVIAPYISWTLNNGMTFISLGDEREKLEKERYVFEQHIARNKRENVIKKACLAIVNGIVPYIDRIINEIYKLKEKGFINNKQIKKEKYQYINELVTTINEYNDILALWIKMKQGSLSLNIENFALDELFSLIAKGRKTFEMKNQAFDVQPTDAIIKADKALTLFMINTLTENARKYTAEGGKISVYARSTDEYVEISVQDNGRGLSAEDLALIKDEKVYDSRLIGMKDGNRTDELKSLKGSGFGLMNCRGIIEKYRKTNRLFDVCTFSVESTLGKGSRFFFRLPLGMRKKIGMLLCLLLPLGLASCHRQAPVADRVPFDSLALATELEYETLLNKASKFSDTAYFCNVIEEYMLALEYADSAIHYLNLHHQKYSPASQVVMELVNNDVPAELTWWDQSFETDYDVILFLRNEAAVSFLALKQWDSYTYNNKAYTALYKLYHEDQSLEAYCLELERSTTNKMVGIWLCVLLIIAYLIGYYVFYIRKRILNRWNLEQVLDINQQVFASSLIHPQDSVEALQREENALKEIPRKIVNEAYESINELLGINVLGLAVFSDSTNKLEFASTPQLDETPAMVYESFSKQTPLSEGRYQSIPLIVDTGSKHLCVGVLYIERQDEIVLETDRLLLELITRYIAIVCFNAVVRVAVRYRDIESAYEDTHRASWEDSMLHVQNMVLDNCLSTIKHETIYYPNKIKQIIGKLSDDKLDPAQEIESIETIAELIDYYKGIFTILSSCASRQLEEVTFRRTTIPVNDLLGSAAKYFKKQLRGKSENISLTTESSPATDLVIGDVNQLNFLFENLINEALTYNEAGEILLSAVTDGKFIRFRFTDTRREKSTEELNQLFYPDLSRMTAGDKGELKETEYLVCKQIIRDHDEYAGRRGCRINAEKAEKGFTVYFTIPKR